MAKRVIINIIINKLGVGGGKQTRGKKSCYLQSRLGWVAKSTLSMSIHSFLFSLLSQNSLWCLPSPGKTGWCVERPLCTSTLLGTGANTICSSEQLSFSSTQASELPDVGKEYISFLKATNKPHNLSEVLCNFITSYISLSKI